ncbi:MAG: hypothetical protein IME96_07545 [Proteobacteria bacterium]|nr:hypothetical protein [Pseudomonadota bacterium]
MNCPPEVSKYLNKFAETKKWSLVARSRDNIDQVVVIPALAERDNIFKTLANLARNSPSELKKTLVICVINNRAKGFSSKEDVNNNQDTLTCLSYLLSKNLFSDDISKNVISADLNQIRQSGMRLAYVDASSPGLELPENGGVGLARKIGMDLSLTAFYYNSKREKLIISLDADTLVEDNYLQALREYFDRERAACAVISYRHQIPEDELNQSAICSYELFLRYYVMGLNYAGSPYAFHTIGSTMACTSKAYLAVGGMNKKEAAEDFYFLQKLAKYDNMGQVHSTTVYPSARISHRVPFGTGKKMKEMLVEKESDIPFYNYNSFIILKKFLRLIGRSANENLCGKDLLSRCCQIDLSLGDYLKSNVFDELWDKLKKNSPHGYGLLKHFHSWFDAFRTLKLIHYLRDHGYETMDMFTAYDGILALRREDATEKTEEELFQQKARLKLLERIRGI